MADGHIYIPKIHMNIMFYDVDGGMFSRGSLLESECGAMICR